MKEIILTEGVYSIPMDLTYKIENRVVTVKRKTDRWRKEGDYRCKECTHRTSGRCKGTSEYSTFVCELKPKGGGLYYGAPPHGGKGCEWFQKKGQL